jgi:hypothetical protein
MNEVGELVIEIEKKIKHFIAEKNSISTQNILLIKEKEELIKKIEEQELIIKQLKEKNSYIKISQSVKQSEGNTDVKNKIDELVREIDKCIGLLNK